MRGHPLPLHAPSTFLLLCPHDFIEVTFERYCRRSFRRALNQVMATRFLTPLMGRWIWGWDPLNAFCENSQKWGGGSPESWKFNEITEINKMQRKMNPGQAWPSPKCFEIHWNPQNIHEHHPKNNKNLENPLRKSPNSWKSAQKQRIFQLILVHFP